MSETTTTTINAGGGITVDVIESKPKKARKSRAKPKKTKYTAEQMAEARAAIATGEYVGFSGEGEITNDDCVQFIELTTTVVEPTPVPMPEPTATVEAVTTAIATDIVIEETKIDGTVVLTDEDIAAKLARYSVVHDTLVGNLHYAEQKGRRIYPAKLLEELNVPADRITTAVIDRARCLAKQVPITTQDFLSLGYAVALADLADARDLTITAASENPTLLEEAGMPKLLPPSVVRRAQQLYRNNRDGLAYRNHTCDGAEPRRPAVVAKPSDNSVTTGATPRGIVAVRPGSARSSIHGFPTTRVVMWLGKHGFNAEQATKVLAHYGAVSTPASIATFLRSGVKGDRGEVAPLTDAQADEIRSIANS